MSGSAVVSRSPQAPEIVVAESPVTSAEAVARAAVTTREAAKQWASEGAATRAGALTAVAAAVERKASRLEDLIVQEVGKPRLEARGEVVRSLAILRYYAQQIYDPIGQTYPPSLPGLLYTRRRPRGIAGLITPWNFPLAIPLWKAAPALAAGNGVLLKPSSASIGCALLLEELLAEALPEHLLTVLVGEQETATAMIAAVDVVSFTGSDSVGRSVSIAGATAGIEVQAEMGGQNAAIVFPSANVEAVARMLMGAAMGFAGQKCTATRRIVAVGEAGALSEALEAELKRLEPSDPADPTTVVGPVISPVAQATVEQAGAEARRVGARVATAPAAQNGEGWFAAPVLVSGLPAGHRLLQDETFGPFAAIVAATDARDAVRHANDVGYGLVASVHTADLSEALGVADALDCGLVKVNAPTTGVDFYAPFGGDKQSSFGPREQGKVAMDFYSSSQTVTLVPLDKIGA